MKKRILSLLMCFALLLSSMAFLASCKKDDGEIETSKKMIDVDLTGYSIITGAELTEAGKQHALSFAQVLSKTTTLTMGVISDTEVVEIETETPEILIGVTSRKESVKTLNSIKGTGWAIRVLENKIVIVGTTPYLTRVALSYFEQTYLNAEHVNGTTLSVNQKITVSEMPTISLVETVDGKDDTFVVVYEKGKDSNDAPHQVGSQVCDSLFESSGVSARFVTCDSDVQEKELLVGNMSRTDVKEEMAKIEADEYAVTVRNGKIYLVAWSDTVLGSTHALFQDMLFSSSFTDDSGNTTYAIPVNCTVVQTYASEWITDFPKPTAENLYPEAAVDVNDGSLQFIYSGSGATRETFVAYCETLKAAGYTPMENEDVQWEGSSFRTFLNSETGVSLHVSHMAFSHAAEEQVEGLVNSIRIVSGTTETGGKLVDSSYFRPQIAGTEEQVKNGTADYVKRMNSQITSNVLDYGSESNKGLGQVITLADGSFIIIDGGKGYGDETNVLWEVLREMHKKAHGSYPTKENPVHIRAWLMSHEHSDHYNVLRYFCDSYGFKPELRFDYLMYNPGSMVQLRTATPSGSLRNNQKLYQEKVKNGFEYIQVSTGQVFYFANCRLEILTTVDDMYPWRPLHHNHASMIVRTALFESDGTNSHESTTLWLGDAETQPSQVARAMYGSFLQSEQVQISHHASVHNVEKRLYELAGSNCVVLWAPKQVVLVTLKRGLLDGGPYSPAILNPNCKLLIFNGSNYGNYPMWSVTLTMSPTGPLLDQLYDATTGEHIEAKGELWPAVDIPAYREKIGV